MPVTIKTPCEKCKSPDTIQKWARQGKKRLYCKQCGHEWTIKRKPLAKELLANIPSFTDELEKDREILDLFDELKNIPSSSVDSMLAADALRTMKSPIAQSAAKNAARDFIQEISKKYTVMEQGNINISFISPEVYKPPHIDEELNEAN